MPMVPPAPGRFSTTTACPRLAASLSVTLRPMTSVTLPGVKGTMTLIVRDGKGSCAKTCEASADRKSVVKGKSVDLGGRRIIKKKKRRRRMGAKTGETKQEQWTRR